MTDAGIDHQAPAIQRQLARQRLERNVVFAAVFWRSNLHLADAYGEFLAAVDHLAAFTVATRSPECVVAPPASAPVGPAKDAPLSASTGPAVSDLRQALVDLAQDAEAYFQRIDQDRCPWWSYKAARKILDQQRFKAVLDGG